MRKNLIKSLAILTSFLGLLVASIPSFGQTQVNGTITGTITDPQGGAVVGATVTATNTSNNVTHTTKTNGSGVYLFSDVAPSIYNISVEKEGFRSCVANGIPLDPAQSRTFSCALQVGATTEKVLVEATALQVDTEAVQLNSVINSEQVQELPVNGRSFANFLALQPGVSGIDFDGMNSMNIFATQGVGVNGLRDSDNNILVEGVSSQRTRNNAALTAQPSIDAISEVNIVASGYMPEYSRGAGAQVIIQLKSGTNNYHGSLYEYNQNTVYDAAKNWFNQGAPTNPINWNNFGGTFGGPLIPHHHKLFFYFSEDITRQPSTSSTTSVVPSALAHQGDFSDYCNAGIGCPSVPAFLNGQTDPNTGQTLVAGQPFPNNQISQVFWSPNGAAFISLYPLPNVPGNTVASDHNYVYNSVGPSNNHTESLKVDYAINDKNHLAVTLRHYRTNSFWSGADGSAQNLDWGILQPERGFTVDLATTFSPTLLNDLTVGSTEDIVHVQLTPWTRGNGLNRSSFGINYSYIFGDASKDIAGKTPTINFGGPNGSVDSVGLFTDAYPSSSVGHIYQLQDVVTKVHGKHTSKFGVWIEKDGERDNDQLVIGGQNLNGTFSFGASPTNPHSTSLPLADMLLGAFDNYTELGYRNQTPWVALQQGYFAQDSWKITPRLTIQGGLRWDLFPPYHSSWCNFSMFDPLLYSTSAGTQQVIDNNSSSPTFGEIIGGNYYNGIAAPCSKLPSSGYNHFGVFGQGFNSTTASTIDSQLAQAGVIRGLRPSILPSKYKNFQPRFGFAWDMFGKGTTSLRGSGGIFYNHETLSDQTQMGRNVPFQTAASVNNGLIDCPGVAQTPGALSCGIGTSAFVPGPVVASPSNPQQPIPVTGQDINNPVPGIYQWHLDVQHMLPQNTLVDVGYVGTRSRHQPVLANLQELPPGTCLAIDCTNLNAVVPYPGFAPTNFTYQLNAGNSQYDALQVSVQRRMSHNLMFTLAYTWANWFDIGDSLASGVANHYNIKYNYGPADGLRHQNFVLTYVYDLPFYKNLDSFMGRVLGGWEIAGVFYARTGTPVTIGDGGQDIAAMGVDNGEHAQLVPGCNPNHASHSGVNWFNPACFVQPNTQTGVLGDSGRNRIWGPGQWNWDASIYKNGHIVGERLTYQFRGEAYNVLNHPSWGGSSTDGLDTGIFDGTFGQVNSVTNPRVLQVGLRLIF